MENAIISHIRIILVGTTHPGNIGATARAMKAMGVEDLYLVDPKVFPAAEATARAAGADDILENARVCETLQEAVRDCTLVFGTSARQRSISWPHVDAREAGKQAVRCAAGAGDAAFVFGRESSGLTNEELDGCNRMLAIPSDPDFSSLNLAAAAQIICYEIRMAMDADIDVSKRGSEYQPVTTEEMSLFYDHLERNLIDLGFLDPEKPRRLMRRLRRLFNRAGPDRNEYNILRGILAAIQDKAGKRED